MRKAIPGEATVFFSLFIACLVVGCGTGKAPDATSRQGLASPPSAEALARLARADAEDGSIDKVISKCVTCQLGMEGKPEYSVAYGGYSVHLCSEECKKTFSGDPEKALLALNPPQEKK